MEKDKIIAEFEIPIYDRANHRTAFIFNARLDQISYVDDGKTIVEYGWFISTSGDHDFKQILLAETDIGKILNAEEISDIPIDKEAAIGLVKPVLDEATKNPNLIPYFYPIELSNDNGELIIPLVEKYDELNLEDWLKENQYCFKDEALVPFLKVEHFFKLSEHVKGLNLHDKELTFFEETIKEAELTIQQIKEGEFYKYFPNEAVAQKYFDDYSEENDKFYSYHIKDEDDDVKLFVVADFDNNWKVFFVVNNI